MKDKEKREEKPSFLDLSCLRSKTLQILLLSAATSALGLYTPLFYLVNHQTTLPLHPLPPHPL